jgi:hypothetical protein
MNNELLMAILVSFAAGVGISWIIFKNRTAVNTGALRNQLFNAEEKNKELNKTVGELLETKENLLREKGELERGNTRLSTEGSITKQTLEQRINELEKLAGNCEIEVRTITSEKAVRTDEAAAGATGIY